jgi:hypothetical protein
MPSQSPWASRTAAAFWHPIGTQQFLDRVGRGRVRFVEQVSVNLHVIVRDECPSLAAMVTGSMRSAIKALA